MTWPDNDWLQGDNHYDDDKYDKSNKCDYESDDCHSNYTESSICRSVDIYALTEEERDYMEFFEEFETAKKRRQEKIEPAKYIRFIDAFNNNAVDRIEEAFHTLDINKTILICDDEDAAERFRVKLADKFHSISHISAEALDDERPNYMRQLRDFEAGFSRLLLMNIDVWKRLSDFPDCGLNMITAFNFLILVNIDNGDTVSVMNDPLCKCTKYIMPINNVEI